MALPYKGEVLLLASAVAGSRFLTRSRYLYDLDSVNFALGIERFDPRVSQPHPPGYFLYIAFGRGLSSLLHDANLALVVLSILASCGVVILTYQLALAWFGLRAARCAGLLFLLSPLAWFHGTVALSYSVEAFFSALLGYLCWRIAGGSERSILPAAVLLGISAGVRPSSLLFLGPLFLFSLRTAPPKRSLVGGAALLLTLAAWFFPMVWASGGFAAYFAALFSLWRMVPSRATVFNSSPATSIARAVTILFIYFLTFGAASLAPLAGLGRTAPHPSKPRLPGTPAPVERAKKVFTLVWIAPALCFFTFIFLKFVNSGYLLLLSPPACIWLGFWASEWYGNCAWRKPVKLAAIGLCAAVNVLIFLDSPFYCSYRSVRRFEAELKSIQTALPQVASPKDTLIVSFDSHFLGFRHAGYYLPGYLTVEYPEVRLREGARVFVMHQRDTRMVAGLPVAAYSRFVLFPLPGGSGFREYLEKVQARVPSQSLRTLRLGGHDFITGPVSDLPLLFPDAAPPAALDVYTSRHSGAPPVNNRSHQPGS